MDIRGGGDGMLQVEEENKLKRKRSQAFMTENDKEEDEFVQSKSILCDGLICI